MIKVSFSKRQFDDIIRELQNLKKELSDTFIDLLLKECYNWFIERANFYVSVSDIGELVKLEIMSSWQYTIDKPNQKIAIKNFSEKAVFVEFGVGKTGEKKQNPLAKSAKYNYNLPSASKDYKGRWIFPTEKDGESLDVPAENIEVLRENEAYGTMWVRTSGAVGVMYVFNAIADLKSFGLEEVAKRAKAKYGY